ncbi:hypothetical protein ACFLXY_01645 [Chloroflexota bacterium]
MKKKQIKANITNNSTHFHLDAVQDIGGFSLTNAEKDHYVRILTRATITSNEPEFYGYIDQLSNPIFSKVGVFRDAVHQFLLIIHNDLSADLFINDFLVSIEMMAKRDVKKGEIVMHHDIADIKRVSFPNISISDSDKVIYCKKIGWKFLLFFDLGRPTKLDIEKMEIDLGKVYRYLSFQYVYDVIENETQFEEMLRDGWFPFIEIIGSEYTSLCSLYQNKFHFEDKINKIIDNFNKERIDNITNKWWRKPVFNEKNEIIRAGINAFLQSNKDGYINSINTLLPQVEGIIRIQYFSDTGKGKSVHLQELLDHLTEKGKTKAGTDSSLLLPLPFFRYLNDVVYANFNLESGTIDLSRHSLAHGVAKPELFSRLKALQAIFILDQIYFYI